MSKPNKQKNTRRCISCHLIGDRSIFWRIVKNYPDHHLTIDEGMGRSAYICPNPSCLTIAQKKKRLSRALKTEIPPDIYQKLWERLEMKN